MKINLNKNELEKTYSLLDTKEINISIADLLFSAFNGDSYFMHQKNDDYFSSLLSYWEIEEGSDDHQLLEKWVKPYIIPTTREEYLSNPYYQNVKPKEIKKDGYEITYLSYKPYLPFPLNDIEVDDKDYFKEGSPISYFKDEFKYLAINRDGETWMCITPNEINTMAPYIKEAKGNVLVLGLGLGYYPFMISLKDEVKNITIIEIDKTIIKLFKEHIFPFFKNKEKITIIEGDAINYLMKTHNNYDTVFVDLWHNAVDGLPIYLKFKQMEDNHRNSHFQYWLEESMIALYRRCILSVYEEALQGYKEKDYLKSQNDIDKVINSIYFKTKNITINSYDDIYKLLKKESILRLIKS